MIKDIQNKLSAENEPDKIRRYRFNDTIFVVGSYYSKENTTSLKGILESAIKREAISDLKVNSLQLVPKKAGYKRCSSV